MSARSEDVLLLDLEAVLYARFRDNATCPQSYSARSKGSMMCAIGADGVFFGGWLVGRWVSGWILRNCSV